MGWKGWAVTTKKKIEEKSEKKKKKKKTHILSTKDRGNQVLGFGEEVNVVKVDEGRVGRLAFLHKVAHVHLVNRNKGTGGHGAIGPQQLIRPCVTLGPRENVVHGLDHPKRGAEDQVIQVPVLEQPQPPLLGQQLVEDLPDFLD